MLAFHANTHPSVRPFNDLVPVIIYTMRGFGRKKKDQRNPGRLGGLKSSVAKYFSFNEISICSLLFWLGLI